MQTRAQFHPCAAKACHHEIPHDEILCQSCWSLLPLSLQRRMAWTSAPGGRKPFPAWMREAERAIADAGSQLDAFAGAR